MTTTPAASPVGTIDRIPVRNILLLMFYASDLYRELPQDRRVAIEDAPDDLPDLAAEILTHAVERRMRRNLSFSYRRRRADLTRVRGRIDLLRTERRQLLKRGRVACSFDELTVDTPRNRFVKAALDLLSGMVSDGNPISPTDAEPRQPVWNAPVLPETSRWNDVGPECLSPASDDLTPMIGRCWLRLVSPSTSLCQLKTSAPLV